MASNKNEFNGNSGGSSSCNYNSLGNYNADSLDPNVTTGYYTVPSFGASGYNALTHNMEGSCGGYFNIQSAYGKGANNCVTQYTNKLCGSCMGQGVGWKCDKASNQCVQGGHLGTQGTFGNKKECEQGCRLMGQNHWVCEPSKLIGGSPSCKSVPSGSHLPPHLQKLHKYDSSSACNSHCKRP